MRGIKRIKMILAVFLLMFLWHSSLLAAQGVEAKIGQQRYKAGEKIVVTGKIPAGQDLYISVASEREFAPEDAEGVNEIKTFQNAVGENGFEMDTTVPVLYYMLTTNPEAFGDVEKKRYGGPSFASGT